MTTTMMLDAMCVDLAAPLDGKRYSMLDLPISYTKEDLTAVLQKACDRENDSYFQIDSIMQEGVKLGTDQRVDYYGIRGGSLIWCFNAPVKVTARLAATDKEPVQHDLWLRQIERGGASTVEVDPHDTAGITWLADNGYTQGSYALSYEGVPLTCSKLRNLAYTSRSSAVTVEVKVCSVIQVLVQSALSVRAITVRADDTVKILRSKYNNLVSAGKRVSMYTQLYQRFSFGNKQLADSGVLCSAGITDGGTVNVAYGGLLGGCAKRNMSALPTKGVSERFADVSEPGVMQNWAKTAPKWSECAPGLCLEGVCTNIECEARFKQVVLNSGFKAFDLVRDNNTNTPELKCPMCQEFVKAQSCGMNNCVWRMAGMKAGSKIVTSTLWERVGDYYYSFKQQPAVEWTRLLIEVTNSCVTPTAA
jgi:hypothetical protein